MKTLDRTFAWLLILGAVLHGAGSVAAGRNNSQLLVWALSGSLAALLVAGLNLLRVNRPLDRPLAMLSFLGSLGWAAVAIGFGISIGNVFDFRPLYHSIAALVLAALSLRTFMSAKASL
jgi:hypothetical protein